MRRVLDILDNIEAARSYAGARDLESFSQSSLIIDGCERCLQRITEAVIKLGEEEFTTIAPNVRFVLIRGMGNMLRHEYDVISARIVYETIHHDLPILERDCRRYLSENGGSE